jgi:hypothetical protein
MRKRILICAGITLLVARILYEFRVLTFAVWTNAALVSHSHPLIAVAAIEGLLVAGIFGVTWVILERAAGE